MGALTSAGFRPWVSQAVDSVAGSVSSAIDRAAPLVKAGLQSAANTVFPKQRPYAALDDATRSKISQAWSLAKTDQQRQIVAKLAREVLGANETDLLAAIPDLYGEMQATPIPPPFGPLRSMAPEVGPAQLPGRVIPRQLPAGPRGALPAAGESTVSRVPPAGTTSPGTSRPYPVRGVGGGVTEPANVRPMSGKVQEATIQAGRTVSAKGFGTGKQFFDESGEAFQVLKKPFKGKFTARSLETGKVKQFSAFEKYTVLKVK